MHITRVVPYRNTTTQARAIEVECYVTVLKASDQMCPLLLSAGLWSFSHIFSYYKFHTLFVLFEKCVAPILKCLFAVGLFKIVLRIVKNC